jgi:DUF1365 family protein
MNNCLYVGHTIHIRKSPILHSFKYKVLYYFLNLDEVPRLFKYPGFFSYNFPGLLSFWRKDYLGHKSESISEAVKKEVYTKTGQTFQGPIYLLTNISYLGFCFNPVSFYYCFDDNQKLKYVVSEITNTPWGEKHANVLEIKDEERIFKFKKDFHVSPFIPMNVDYSWSLSLPENVLKIKMENRFHHSSDVFFEAILNLRQEPLNFLNIFKYFFTLPLTSFKTMFGIYLQAFKLYLKKAPFYTHPKKGEIS